MNVNPVFVALSVMFLVVTVGVWVTHGDNWWAVPVSLWFVHTLWASTPRSRR